ncbi:MAG: hypothetical protein AAFX08_02810 [Pseudomonadota bacterium]
MPISKATPNAMPRNAAAMEDGEMSAARIGLFLAIGAVFWFLAALMVRFAGPMAFDVGLRHLFLYAACAPLGFVSTWAIARITATPLNAMVGPMVIMITIATFLDGAALVWAPALYGGAAIAAHGGAAILWGVGCFFVAALVFAGGRVRA